MRESRVFDRHCLVWQLRFGKSQGDVNKNQDIIERIIVLINVSDLLIDSGDGLTPGLKQKLAGTLWQIGQPLIGIDSSASGTAENIRIIMILWIILYKQFRRKIIPICIINEKGRSVL